MTKSLNFYRKLPWFKGKLRLGKKLFKKYIEKSEPVTFEAHDGIMYHIPNTIENIGIELLVNGIYERKDVKFLKDHIPDNSIYFDIGANIGSLGLPIIKNKPQIQYYGFEASPLVFPFLQKNFELNQVTNYTLVNKLVHKDARQSMKFYQSKWYGKSSLAPTYSHEFVMVDSVSIDQYCFDKNIETIDWMKIDVEGFELYVFEGMERMLINKKVKNILFEFESWAEEAAGLKGGAAKAYIENMGYDLFSIKEKPWSDSAMGSNTMIWAKLKN